MGLCLINGMLFDETDELFISLNEINATKSDSNGETFTELMNFRTLSRDLPNGFTVGSVLPLRRTTLLSIIDLYLKYNIN